MTGAGVSGVERLTADRCVSRRQMRTDEYPRDLPVTMSNLGCDRISHGDAQVSVETCRQHISSDHAQTNQAQIGHYATRGRRAEGLRISSTHCNRFVPSNFAKSRSNVPSGVCPALRAISRTRQSEKPNAGRFLKCSKAAVTTSAS